MNIQNVDYIFKILIIGDSSVGKSNILLRYTDNIFHDTFLPTIGVDFKVRQIELLNKKIKLNIWDTAGQERFKTITATYYKGSLGIILVFDITEPESFENINMWMGEVAKHASSNVVKLLIGNKCDLEEKRKVSREEAEEFAKSHNIKYIECSAKSDVNIKEAFDEISKQIYNVLPESEKRMTRDGDYDSGLRRRNDNGGKCC